MEYVFAATGPRGGGKSMEIARLAYEHMIEDGGKVYSNYAIEGNWGEGHFKAELLDTSSMYQFSEGYRGGLLCVDEFQFYADNRRSSSTANRLITMVGTQLRKRQMSVGLSVQNIEWIDLRWRFQVDCQLRCRDLMHTPWGRECGLKRGQIILVQAFDMTGIMTGQGVWETKVAVPYLQYRVNGHSLFNKFDTEALVGMEEIFRTYEVEKQKIPVSYGDHNFADYDERQIDATPYASQLRTATPLGDLVESAVFQLAKAGVKAVTAAEIHGILADNGLMFPVNKVGEAINRVPGVKRRHSSGKLLADLEGVLENYE